MSQTIFTSIDPTISGTTLATTLNAFKDAIVSGCSGTSRPANIEAGGAWVDTTNDPTSWAFKIYTGSTDVVIFTINLTTGIGSVALAVDSFQVKKVSADTVGAILALIKQRIANNGQVLNGDVVGEIRVTGRTNSSTNPVVAKIIFTAADNQTTSAYGGTLSFQSTPAGTATLTEHFRLITGLFETVVPHKLNSQLLVGQNVATSATIAQLSASKILVEMTGSTPTTIQGINSGNDSQTVTIHNRSTATVILSHQDAGAASADRLKLPNAVNYRIIADGSATLYYCSTDGAWKLLSTSEITNAGATLTKFFGITQTWTAPTTTSVASIRAFRLQNGINTERSGMVDYYGNAYAWGLNLNGQLGVGDVAARSSPVAVLGSLQFLRTYGATSATQASYGIANTGQAYAWGNNISGQLGVGDVVPRSSPVAITALRFNSLVPRDSSVTGITTAGLLYAWGINTNGQVGDGTVIPKSAPVAVLSSLRFGKLSASSGVAGSSALVALTTTGVAYAWGLNTNGNLGVGDVAPRSSPVAVLGSLTFSDVLTGGVSSRYFAVGLTSAGLAYAWGSNTNSNLGVGDQTPRSSPVAVLGGLTFARLFGHEKSESFMAMTSAGAVYAWGDNTQGALGVGDLVNRSSPVAVLGGLTFKKIILYKSSVYGLTTDGVLYAWGINTNGQLGVGDVVSRSSPVAVLGGLTFFDVDVADSVTDTYSIFGLTQDGLVYAWGANASGTLGLGDVVPRSSPVAVLGAFAPDPRELMSNFDLTVTAGQTYTIGLGASGGYFGSTPLGRDCYRVEVEYYQ